MTYSRVPLSVAPLRRPRTASVSNRPDAGAGAGAVVSSEDSRWIAYTEQQHTRAHTCAAARRRRGPVQAGYAAARTSLSTVGQPHGMATAGATRRARRFKRYVTVSPGPIIGRRDLRRPIGRALAESRGKTKCSVTVARRKSTANSRAQFFNRSPRRCLNKSEPRLCLSQCLFAPSPHRYI